MARLGRVAPRGCFWKLAQPDGWDFYTGSTINYRQNMGKEVSPPGELGLQLCGPGLIHASKNPNDCFVGARIPCSAYLIKGKPAIKTKEKCGFHQIVVLEEIHDLDALFGWNYTEAANPIYPFKIERGFVSPEEIALLATWASVWDSVGASAWASVWDSVGASVRDSVGDSVGDSVWAYIGSLFPIWRKTYPYQAAANLWRAGLIPSFDGRVWRLHAGPNGRILYEGRN